MAWKLALVYCFIYASRTNRTPFVLVSHLDAEMAAGSEGEAIPGMAGE